MADAEVVKYNKTIEKLCVDCAAEVGRELAGCKQVIKNRLGKLSNDIIKVSVPSAVDLSKVPDQIDAILLRENSHFANVLLMKAGVKLDGSGRKLALTAWGVGGSMALI